MAIVHAILLSTLIATMAAGASLLSQLESRIADHHRTTREAAYVARGAAAIAIHELRDMPDWTVALSGGAVAAFTSPVPPGGEAICCGPASLTARLRDGTGRPWAPFGWSPAARLLGSPDPRLYIVVWVADDPGDEDGDAATDSNSSLAIHVEARREDGLAVAAEAVVDRTPVAGSGLYLRYPPSTIGPTASAAAPVRLRSWREVFVR
jgi:hypothetical protein